MSTKKRKSEYLVSSDNEDDGHGTEQEFDLLERKPSVIAKAMLAWLPQGATMQTREAQHFFAAVHIVKARLKQQQNTAPAVKNKPKKIDLLEAPHIIANTLLAWMPANDVPQSVELANFRKAFAIVMKELRSRTKRLVLDSEAEGSKEPIVFSGVSVPSDVVTKILAFLPRKTIVAQVALVSKVLLAETRKCRWKELSWSRHSSFGQNLNMTKLLQLLRSSPQFCDLRELKMPRRVKFGTSGIQSLSESCPLLTDINFSETRIKEADILTVVKNLRHLSGITCEINDVMKFVTAIGARLRRLSMVGLLQQHFRIDDWMAVADTCPNLERLENWTGGGLVVGLDSFETALPNLLRKCTNLRHLKLCRIWRISVLHEISKVPHHLMSFQFERVSIDAFNWISARLGDDGAVDAAFAVIEEQMTRNRDMIQATN